MTPEEILQVEKDIVATLKNIYDPEIPVNIYDLEAKTEDRTDFSVAFWHPEAPLTGFNVRCRLSSMNPLLDGGRTANLKLEQSGVKFATPTVNKVNALPESPTEVTERMLMIERLGGVLKYSDVADRVFRCNLLMIDLHFPRMLAEMVRMMHLDGIARISELTERIKEINPLKIKDELINKHGFYEFKMKQFLLALAFGMRPAKIYNGTDSAVEGILLVDAEGEVLCYHKSEHRTFADFLFPRAETLGFGIGEKRVGFHEITGHPNNSAEECVCIRIAALNLHERVFPFRSHCGRRDLFRQNTDEVAAVLRGNEGFALALCKAGFHQLFNDTGAVSYTHLRAHET